MSTENNVLKLMKRSLLGRKSKNLQKENFTSGVVYNSKTESTPVQVESNTLLKHLKNVSLTTIFDLDIEGKAIKALIKEIQKNPITDKITHISFFEIDPQKEMRFEVPISITGISLAVKNNLGTLIVVKDSLELKCTLDKLPENIVVDISKLDNIGDTIQIKDINLPEGVKLVRKEDLALTLITISELEKEIVIEETVASTEVATEGTAEAGTGESATEEGAVEEGKKE